MYCKNHGFLILSFYTENIEKLIFSESKWLLLYSIYHKQANNKFGSCARHELGESL